MKEITEEDIGKSFVASDIGISFHFPGHKTVTILDVWVSNGCKHIKWQCNENKNIIKYIMRKYQKPNARWRRHLPPSFP